LEWPREESNLRPQIRSLPLYPLSYGALAPVCQLLLRKSGDHRTIRRKQSVELRRRVADGIRTRDHRDHNPGLYQLSYRHQAAATG
jgi:hypothetical protein